MIVFGVQLITQLIKEVEGSDVHISDALQRACPTPKVICQVSPLAMVEAITVAQLTAPQTRDIFQYFNEYFNAELARLGVGIGPYVTDPSANRADKRYSLFLGFSTVVKQYA
jgi:hypothetical protein